MVASRLNEWMPKGTGSMFGKEVRVAKTKGDKKIVHVRAYTKKLNGKLVKVGEHYRSTED